MYQVQDPSRRAVTRLMAKTELVFACSNPPDELRPDFIDSLWGECVKKNTELSHIFIFAKLHNFQSSNLLGRWIRYPQVNKKPGN